ncbi:hypothetical protein HMN09_01119200 [Mycena chlorophos]|uniref:Uncharacterized protein n=1 Tax=Mycena chlorophos TaxID=658473 RepID=A0A8H6W1B8_MYCCL|nr:hypothetical protein HMN09_01119200 [Mycena chlorophos]
MSAAKPSHEARRPTRLPVSLTTTSLTAAFTPGRPGIWPEERSCGPEIRRGTGNGFVHTDYEGSTPTPHPAGFSRTCRNLLHQLAIRRRFAMGNEQDSRARKQPP